MHLALVKSVYATTKVKYENRLSSLFYTMPRNHFSNAITELTHELAHIPLAFNSSMAALDLFSALCPIPLRTSGVLEN